MNLKKHVNAIGNISIVGFGAMGISEFYVIQMPMKLSML